MSSAILQTVPRRFVQNLGNGRSMVHLDMYCYDQALYNSTHMSPPHVAKGELRMVLGSLGVGVTDPFYDVGRVEYTTVEHFRNSRYTHLNVDGSVSWDAHVWLEDSKGRVYDTVSLSVMRCAHLHRKEIGFSYRHIICGMTKLDLARLGLHYVAAPVHTQSCILRKLRYDRLPEYTMFERSMQDILKRWDETRKDDDAKMRGVWIEISKLTIARDNIRQEQQPRRRRHHQSTHASEVLRRVLSNVVNLVSFTGVLMVCAVAIVYLAYYLSIASCVTCVVVPSV